MRVRLARLSRQNPTVAALGSHRWYLNGDNVGDFYGDVDAIIDNQIVRELKNHEYLHRLPLGPSAMASANAFAAAESEAV